MSCTAPLGNRRQPKKKRCGAERQLGCVLQRSVRYCARSAMSLSKPTASGTASLRAFMRRALIDAVQATYQCGFQPCKAAQWGPEPDESTGGNRLARAPAFLAIFSRRGALGDCATTAIARGDHRCRHRHQWGAGRYEAGDRDLQVFFFQAKGATGKPQFQVIQVRTL